MRPMRSSQKTTPAPRMARPKMRRGSGGSRRRSRLMASSSRHVEHGAYGDAAADDDQQQGPRVRKSQIEQMQAHELQPRAEADQPEAGPDRPQAEELGDADQHDDHRPPGPDGVAEVAGEKSHAGGDQDQSGEE